MAQYGKQRKFSKTHLASFTFPPSLFVLDSHDRSLCVSPQPPGMGEGVMASLPDRDNEWVHQVMRGKEEGENVRLP